MLALATFLALHAAPAVVEQAVARSVEGEQTRAVVSEYRAAPGCAPEQVEAPRAIKSSGMVAVRVRGAGCRAVAWVRVRVEAQVMIAARPLRAGDGVRERGPGSAPCEPRLPGPDVPTHARDRADGEGGEHAPQRPLERPRDLHRRERRRAVLPEHRAVHDEDQRLQQRLGDRRQREPPDFAGELHSGAGSGGGGPHHSPTFAIEAQGSAGVRAPPFWSSSMECPSGDLMNAIRPSRGGRWMTTPASRSRAQVWWMSSTS